ncbi:MAG: FISUMP domain-containing protein, partial [Bacteroidales bacterium]|nr:FISUMP domain-containing protein [Bacteroidales bacterium]
MKRILLNMCMMLLMLMAFTYSYSQQKGDWDLKGGSPTFTTFATTNTGSNAIPNNKVLALLKGSDGKLWIGTNEGLAVLLSDGETWENYTESDGIVSNTINALIETIDGNIWIGTSNGISKYDGTSFTSYESLPNKNVQSFAMETDGTLWAGTIGGVAYLDGNYWQTLYGLPSSSGYDVLAASDGTIWIAGANGLSVYDGTNIVTYTTENGLPSNYTKALAEDSNGNIWIGTGWSGLVKYDGTNFTAYSETEGLVGDGVKDVKVDENGVIWVATLGGVSKYNGTSFTNYTKTEGLAHNAVNTILVQTPTSLLFGTDNGISNFTDNTWVTLNTADGLINNYLLAIHGNSQGLIAFGTYTGGASIFNGTTWTEVSTNNDKLPSNWVKSVLVEENGNVWFGTSQGAVLFNGTEYILYNNTNGLPDDDIESLAQDLDGNIWFATSKGISKFNGTTFTNYSEGNGLISKFTKRIFANKNDIWIGTSSGISVFSGGVFTNYTTEDGLLKNIVNSFEFDDEYVWIASDDGLTRFDGTNFVNYTTTEGLPAGKVKTVTYDANSVLWIGLSPDWGDGGGVAYRNGDQWIVYNKSNSDIISNTVEAIFAAADTDLWVATTVGASRLSQELVFQEPQVTTTTITSITQTTATGGGNITDNGGADVTARGVCWSTSPAPTITDSKTEDGAGVGEFTSNLTGLTANTTYYVRAYATNSAGTGYGNEVVFTTEEEYSGETVTDIDGNVYPVVEIGTQKWMGKNLETTQLNDGTAIDNNTGTNWTTDVTPAYCWYNDDIINKDRYGALYNFHAVATEKLCPVGWHVPTDEDWNILETFLDPLGDDNAGGKMKSPRTEPEAHPRWDSPNEGATNESGFSALPGGFRSVGDGFQYVGHHGRWWSSSPVANIPNRATYKSMYHNSVRLSGTSNLTKELGYSVRCVEGEATIVSPIVTTNAITNITQTTATSGGNITDDGGAEVTARGVCWSTSPAPTITDSKTEDGIGLGEFISNLTGLIANTTYYVRAYATNSAGTGYGNEVVFTTLEDATADPLPLPFVDGFEGDISHWTIRDDDGDGYSWVISSDDPHSGTKHLKVHWNPSGNDDWLISPLLSFPAGESISFSLWAKSEYSSLLESFDVKVISNNGQQIDNISSEVDIPNAYTEFSYNLSSYAGQNVKVAIVCVSVDQYYLFVDDFSCQIAEQATEAPTVTTTTISSITQTTATGGGNVTSDGDAEVTSRGVCWSTTQNPTVADSKTEDGTGVGEFISELAGLTANTTYYVRAYATNSAGTGYGEQKEFTTLEDATADPLPLPFFENFDGEIHNWIVLDLDGDGNKWEFFENTAEVEVAYSGVICAGVKYNPNGNNDWLITPLLTLPAGEEIEFSFWAKSQDPAYLESFDIQISTDEGVSFTKIGYETDISASYTKYSYDLSGYAGQNVHVAIVCVSVDKFYLLVDDIKCVVGSSAEIPTLVTMNVTNVTQTTASSGGTITDSGGADITGKGVVWSATANPTLGSNDGHTENGTGATEFTSELAGLTANTTYYVRAYATNSAGTGYGEQKEFTTSPAAVVPALLTMNVTNITQTTASSGGAITDSGGADITGKGVVWSATANPTLGSNDGHTENGTGTTEFTSELAGLTAGTTYYVRAYATNSAGTGYGEQKEFTTSPAAVVPALLTMNVTNITQTTASSGGAITDSGGADITAKGVVWSATANPTLGSNDGHTENGTGTTEFTSELAGLTAGTTYYVRAYATNSAGTGYGEQKEFTTSPAAVVPALLTMNVTNITQTTA